jgi:hypothetical protein
LEWGQEKIIAGKFGDLSNNVYFCNKIKISHGTDRIFNGKECLQDNAQKVA